MVQVLGTWHWAACMTDQCAVLGKVPLRIDIDESPMPKVYPGAVGNICKHHGHNMREPRRPATRGEQRMHLTYVAMICDIPWIQDILPQLLVVPERFLPVQMWRTIDSELPPKYIPSPEQLPVAEHLNIQEHLEASA